MFIYGLLPIRKAGAWKYRSLHVSTYLPYLASFQNLYTLWKKVLNFCLVLPYLAVDFRVEIERHIAEQIALHAFTTDLGDLSTIWKSQRN